MFDRGDFGILLLFAGLSFLPLTVIYFLLRDFGWSGKERLFLNTWLVWLSWFFSNLLAVFFLGSIATGLMALFRYSSAASIFAIVVAIFLSNSLAVAITIRFASLKAAERIFMGSEGSIQAIPLTNVAEQAVITGVLAWASAVAGVIGAGLVFSLYESLCPLQGSFGIYDFL